mmetsp:Transcript_38633/g.102039  ORF Transcript_38633/g.102039 Transcript_38633/m.102039 type:complete len:89 (+) Transcript_38633:147-413(+)
MFRDKILGFPVTRGSMENTGAGPSACRRNAMSPSATQVGAAVFEHLTRFLVNWQAIMAAGGPGGPHGRGLPSPAEAEYHTFPPVRAMK